MARYKGHGKVQQGASSKMDVETSGGKVESLERCDPF